MIKQRFNICTLSLYELNQSHILVIFYDWEVIATLDPLWRRHCTGGMNFLELAENWNRIQTQRRLTYTGKPSLKGDVSQTLPPIRHRLVSHDVGRVTVSYNKTHVACL